MSNLNCRWASADELVRITEPAPEPEVTARYGETPALAMLVAVKAAEGKRKAVKAPVAAAMTLEPKNETASGSTDDAADLAGSGSVGADAVTDGRAEPAPEEPAEAAIAEPVQAWAAMISPPRLPLIGTEKVFALMGPREGAEGEARQVDISPQSANFHTQLSTPSKWRWQRLGADIVLLGSGVTQWASLREGLLDRR